VRSAESDEWNFFIFRQRPGGMPDDSDLKPKKSLGSFFGAKKKKAPEPEPEPEKKKNWWTL
jgi:hypothetical protein